MIVFFFLKHPDGVIQCFSTLESQLLLNVLQEIANTDI